jgi:hypothetical protein
MRWAMALASWSLVILIVAAIDPSPPFAGSKWRSSLIPTKVRALIVVRNVLWASGPELDRRS